MKNQEDIKNKAYSSLKEYMNKFHSIDEQTWASLLEFTKLRFVEKDEPIYGFAKSF